MSYLATGTVLIETEAQRVQAIQARLEAQRAEAQRVQAYHDRLGQPDPGQQHLPLSPAQQRPVTSKPKLPLDQQKLVIASAGLGFRGGLLVAAAAVAAYYVLFKRRK